MVKNFKNIFLRNQEADDLKLGIQHRVLEYYQCVHMMTFHMMTLTIFMTGSYLFRNASAWVKAYTALSANVFPSLF